ncbi:RDD family protein [Salisediminibacterium selenitireducens]|uniref:RDD domain containing protein n=1 Tax=Bacillus selenitireducens (strain ATCC 700615 / DSM 15326 / MLS10) TaxID=439292 RepID=D6XSQ7_BACIE|nr:RDD family protein [Salisediminibacterium selenitireducens]ADH98843.1 RDD domain containing protein [[Bacillus] selenitireducens MLS10]
MTEINHSNPFEEEEDERPEPARYENMDDYETMTFYYAGFWMRFWAYLVDLIAAGSLSGLILGIIYMLVNLDELTIGIYSAAGALSALITFTYFVIMTKIWGQTLGKMALGVRVIPFERKELNWMDVIFREVIGRFIHRSLVVTNVLYVIVAFAPTKRGLHDRIGNSIVILEPRKGFTVPVKKKEEAS